VAHDFTPRRVGEILDDAIGLIRSNFATLGPVMGAVMLPVAAAYSVVASFYMRTFLELFGQTLSNSTAGVAAGPGPEVVVIAMLMNVLGLLYFAARAMLDATIYANSSQLLERRHVGLKDALSTGLRSVGPLVAVQIIAGLAAGAIMVVFVIVGVILSIAFFAINEAAGASAIIGLYILALLGYAAVATLLVLASPVVVIEGSIGRALGRSLRLVRRHFWRVLLVLIATGLLVTQFESALAAPTLIRELIMGARSPLSVFSEIHWGWKVFDGLIQGVAISVVLPFSAAVMLLTYLDLRARDEGMDLVIRARKLLPE
jgi:hypothetical protein